MTDITWSDTIRIKPDAELEMRPGALAAICGLRKVDTNEQALQLGHPIGSILYLVGFGDGVALEVPETAVELIADEDIE